MASMARHMVRWDSDCGCDMHIYQDDAADINSLEDIVDWFIEAILARVYTLKDIDVEADYTVNGIEIPGNTLRSLITDEIGED